MASSKFVSPGVFTRETNLTFVSQQVGVTTLGLVGETLKGPAFEPIFISDYEEFTALFGGQHPKRFSNDIPKYELPYVAKQYLSQSNQLFVTRILGLTGYDAGGAWIISASANIDPSTSGVTNSVNFTADFNGSIYSNFSDPSAEYLYDLGLFENASVVGLGNSFNSPDNTDVYPLGAVFTKISSTEFSGTSANVTVTTLSGGTEGTVSGTVFTYSGTSYSDIEGMQLALIRSRGDVELSSGELTFRTEQQSGGLVMSGTDQENDPLAGFTLTTYGDSNFTGGTDYEVSLDRTSRNFLPRVIGSTCDDKETMVWVEEIGTNLIGDLIDKDMIYGIDTSLTYFNTMANYKQPYQTPETPWIVSELRGNVVDKLFKFVSISDGSAANKEIKISISNIRPDTKQFDILVRDYNDTDARPVIIERFSKVTMDPADNNFVAQRVGTADGEFELRSRYIMLVMNPNAPTDAFPSGFEGYNVRTYGATDIQAPKVVYKTEYDTSNEKIKKVYLGISNVTGIDQTMFNWKGLETDDSPWGGETKGFHMDSGAAVAGNFEVGADEFRTSSGIDGTSYDSIFARKFTFVPYCGFDGWNCYRTTRTNSDRYRVGQVGYTNGVNELEFVNTTNPDLGTSDYYAYLNGIKTFENPESVNINIFATPGIDYSNNTSLISEAIGMIEEDRSDSLYIVNSPEGVTTGEESLEGKGFSTADITTSEDIVDILDIADIDSNYTATYWPWVQERDNENNVNVWLPPTLEVVRNIALTDNVSFPWFAVAGYSRGTTNALQARVKLTESDRDTLYEGRINPMATFSDQGVVIWGNKNLQVKESALNRINIRRLLLQARKLISAVAVRLLFEQNDQVVRNQFLNSVNPILDNIRRERGLTDFRVVVSDDPEEIDRREMTGRIFLKPTPTLEFIELEFVVTPTGASFDDI